MQKIYFSDLDDTLIGKDGYPQEINEVIKKINQNGDLFVPCSGRPLGSMKTMFKDTGVKYLIAYNGAEIYDLEKQKLIYSLGIEKEEVTLIINELKKFNVDYILYGERGYSNNIENEYIQIEKELAKIEIEKIEETIPSPKVLGVCNPEIIDEIIGQLKIKFPEYYIMKSKPFFIEIVKKGISKGNGIMQLLKYLQLDIKANEVYCFGDSNNDVSMFELDINTIAVGNANEEIKKLAKEVIDTCDNQGVIKFINKIYEEKND